MTEENRKRLAESNRQRIWTEESKRKNSEAHKGSHHSEESRAKMSASQKGKKRGPTSPEAIEKNRQSHLGKKASPEAKAKMSASHKGRNTGPHPYTSESNRNRVWTAESRAKVSARCKGKPLSASAKAKMSAVRKGVQKSEETRCRMSESRKDMSAPANRARSEATSRSNVQRNLAGHDFNVKGYYGSLKCTKSPVAYRSVSLELRLMTEFDANPEVRSWESPVTVRYKNSKGVHKHTLPDFLVTFTDGTRRVIEGKGPHLLEEYLAGEKFEAVKSWCLSEDLSFSVVTTSGKNMDLKWMVIL